MMANELSKNSKALQKDQELLNRRIQAQKYSSTVEHKSRICETMYLITDTTKNKIMVINYICGF